MWIAVSHLKQSATPDSSIIETAAAYCHDAFLHLLRQSSLRVSSVSLVKFIAINANGKSYSTTTSSMNH